MAMVRKQIYLPAKLDKELKAEAKRRKISQAELIRERIEGRPIQTKEQREARDSLLKFLREIREKAQDGPGTGWKFDRDELYAERREKALGIGRYKRPRDGSRSPGGRKARAG
jgi:hypothetical protein